MSSELAARLFDIRNSRLDEIGPARIVEREQLRRLSRSAIPRARARGGSRGDDAR